VVKLFLLVALIAVAIYLTVRIIERRGLTSPGSPAKRRPRGPDDDPDFLNGLGGGKR
jgi:hypothetical protein